MNQLGDWLGFVTSIRGRLVKKLWAGGNVWVSRWRSSSLWPKLTVTKRIGGVDFEMDLELDSTGFRMYYGRYAPLVVRALRSLLRQGDTVFDVGANIGFLSAVAADAVGPTGQVHSFEPVPSNFRKLRRLAEINPGYTIVANQVAVGENEGDVTIRMSLTNIDSHTLVPHLGNPEDTVTVLKVPMITLDSYVKQAGLSQLALIKIDVEGFEFPVLRGLQGFLEMGHQPAIIAEVFPPAYPLLGYTLADLARFMRRYGYRAYSPDAIGKTEIDVTILSNVQDVVFLDLDRDRWGRPAAI